MITKTHCLSIALFIFLASCKTDYSEGYSIKDFRKPLRPYLTKIVSKGDIRSSSETLHNMLTDDELLLLTKCEHPVLRAWAFPEMKTRKSLDYQKELLNHLDDTALAAIYQGDFSSKYETVSDFALEVAEWENWEAKNKVIDKVVMEHNYLKSAYTILRNIEPRDKYYPYIRDMAIRRRDFDEEYGEQGFEDIECALYGLAKFQKKEDVKLIKAVLLPNARDLTSLSFELMKTYPDTAYLEVFERYFPKVYYWVLRSDRMSYLALDFTSSIAVYRNERSAKILDSILNGKQSCCLAISSGWMRNDLLYDIWSNPCEAYKKLRNQIAEEVKKNGIDTEYHDPHIWSPKPLDPLVRSLGWLY